MNNSIVMAVSDRPVSSRGEGGRGRLKGGIVGNSQSPIGTQAGGSAFSEIPVGQAQKIGYLLRTGFMGGEPSVSLPIA